MLTAFLACLKNATQANARVFPAPAPPGTAPPYITLTPIGSDLGMALDGPNGSHDLSLQIDCWASTAANALTLGWEAIHVLKDEGLGIGRIHLLPARYEPDTRLHRVSWEVQALRSLPTLP